MLHPKTPGHIWWGYRVYTSRLMGLSQRGATQVEPRFKPRLNLGLTRLVDTDDTSDQEPSDGGF